MKKLALPKFLPKLMKKISTEWNKLDLPTRSLFLIGLLLLVELVYSILINNTATEQNYDAVFRTSLSSIFGYIFGMNTEVKLFSESKDSANQKRSNKTDEEKLIHKYVATQKAIVLRVTYATVVCVICILTLMIAQHLHTYSYVEGLLQVRNLISLTIGFLLSQANSS
ncbi:MAG TPA: hypothetical protein DCY20_11200 [Firmicutes bacterium]|nr:hypothetical protein [Bacillota bacterium]